MEDMNKTFEYLFNQLPAVWQQNYYNWADNGMGDLIGCFEDQIPEPLCKLIWAVQYAHSAKIEMHELREKAARAKIEMHELRNKAARYDAISVALSR